MDSIPVLPASPTRGVPPLFVKHSTFTSPIGGLDLCLAVEKVTGKDTVEGVQRMGDLYRIYLKNQNARDTALVNGISYNNCSISLLSHNPFQVRDQNTNTTKIFIGNVPLSVDDSEIERALLEQGVVFKSALKFETYRTPDGKWTHFKTGRRFIYTEIPKLNLNSFLKIGVWRASIFYREQTRPSKRNQGDPPLPPPADFASAVTDTESTHKSNSDSIPNTDASISQIEADIGINTDDSDIESPTVSSNHDNAHMDNNSMHEAGNVTSEGNNIDSDIQTPPVDSGSDISSLDNNTNLEKPLIESKGKGETSFPFGQSSESRGRSIARRSDKINKLTDWSKSTARSVSHKRKKTMSPNSNNDQSRKTPKNNNFANRQSNPSKNSPRT